MHNTILALQRIFACFLSFEPILSEELQENNRVMMTQRQIIVWNIAQV